MEATAWAEAHPIPWVSGATATRNRHDRFHAMALGFTLDGRPGEVYGIYPTIPVGINGRYKRFAKVRYLVNYRSEDFPAWQERQKSKWFG